MQCAVLQQTVHRMSPKKERVALCAPSAGTVIAADGSQIRWTLSDRRSFWLALIDLGRKTVTLLKTGTEADAQRVAEYTLGVLSTRSSGEMPSMHQLPYPMFIWLCII